MDEQDNKDPDIISITDDDLAAADQTIKSSNDFFSNPNPKPARPTALVDVICVTTKRKFAAYFEQPKPNSWVLMQYIDDSVIGAPQYVRTTSSQHDLISGEIDWGLCGTKLFCPYCQSPDLIKCGNCHTMSCHVDTKKDNTFHCPSCGNSGTISGTISSLDGSSGKKR
jgi:hypothetical protein